jgi:hypothetical protein
MKLRKECAFDPCARFVSGPETVAEGLYDVISCDPDVRRPVFDHLYNCTENSGHSAVGRIGFLEPPDSVEVTKEFVCAVDQVNNHRRQRSEVRSQGSGVRGA